MEKYESQIILLLEKKAKLYKKQNIFGKNMLNSRKENFIYKGEKYGRYWNKSYWNRYSRK